jgi:hypothetical protein
VVLVGTTEFGSSTFLPNPYYSNFRTAINAIHFNRPQPYNENCEGDTFYYSASDSWTSGDPSFRFDCGTLFVWPDKERHVRANATTKSSALGSGSRTHAQGQYDRGTIASWGATDNFMTTFSAK